MSNEPTLAPYVHPDPPPSPPGYQLPKVYSGRLNDGMNVIVIAFEDDGLHEVRIKPAPNVPGFEGLAMTASRYATTVRDGYRLTGEIDVILPALVSRHQSPGSYR